MPSILFANKDSLITPVMAAALAGSMADGRIKAFAASEKKQTISPQAKKVFKSLSIALPRKTLDVAKVDFLTYDLVIYFSDTEQTFYPALPGMPPLVRWNIHPSETISTKTISSLKEKIQSQLENLLSQGYFTALIQSRRNAELLLDNLHEGILAHDMERRIFFFNQAAEKITGFNRKDVLGKDCHTVFTSGFCGEQCSFCDGPPKLGPNALNYNLEFSNLENEKKILDMSIVAIRDLLGTTLGVVASFRDMTRENELAKQLDRSDQFSGIIGQDPKMKELYRTIDDLAKSNAPVLIEGESGTGKELVAAAIHNEGARCDRLFVPVNCGALPENLLESELFGHVRGAFTGAIRNKKGRFELADGGTLFLDEIGDISPAMQVKLLRVLQDGTFQRVGDEKILKSDVRVVSATHKDLKKEIAAGRFREDLYYRLCVVPLNLPSLRERRSDIPLLARQFLKRFLEEENREDVVITSETMDLLLAHSWPGNVRELQNVIRFLLVGCREGVIRPHHLPPNIKEQPQTTRILTPSPKRRGKLQEAAVRRALQETDGNRLQAAKLLNVSRATLYRFLDRISLDS